MTDLVTVTIGERAVQGGPCSDPAHETATGFPQPLAVTCCKPAFALREAAGLDTSLGQTKVYRTATNPPQVAEAGARVEHA